VAKGFLPWIKNESSFESNGQRTPGDDSWIELGTTDQSAATKSTPVTSRGGWDSRRCGSNLAYHRPGARTAKPIKGAPQGVHEIVCLMSCRRVHPRLISRCL
jgi:hypothetical protein